VIVIDFIGLAKVDQVLKQVVQVKKALWFITKMNFEAARLSLLSESRCSICSSCEDEEMSKMKFTEGTQK
jgi:hypothetical protein